MLRNRKNIAGYSLIEVATAMVIMSLAFPAIAFMLAAANETDSDVNSSTTAYFLASSLMNEISERRFWQSPSFPGNGPEAGEVTPGSYSRMLFNDIDDYNYFKTTWGAVSPPHDELGNVLNQYQMFSQYVSVVNIAPPDPNGGTRSYAAVGDGSTDSKLVTVTIAWNRGNYTIQKVFDRP